MGSNGDVSPRGERDREVRGIERISAPSPLDQGAGATPTRYSVESPKLQPPLVS